MEPEETFRFDAEIWCYSAAKASWYFLTVPEDISHHIRFMAGSSKGFGSVRVAATIGGSRWATSLFPDKKSGCFFLPVKAAIRRAEGVTTGDRVAVELRTG